MLTAVETNSNPETSYRSVNCCGGWQSTLLAQSEYQLVIRKGKGYVLLTQKGKFSKVTKFQKVSKGSATYNTARLVANILALLVDISTHFIKNSPDLVNKLSSYTLSPDEQLVSLDVRAPCSLRYPHSTHSVSIS